MRRAVPLAVALALTLSPMCASATEITVDSAADVLADDGACTLREAVIAANTDAPSGASSGECPAGSGVDLIVVPAGVYAFALPGPDSGRRR